MTIENVTKVTYLSTLNVQLEKLHYCWVREVVACIIVLHERCLLKDNHINSFRPSINVHLKHQSEI